MGLGLLPAQQLGMLAAGSTMQLPNTLAYSALQWTGQQGAGMFAGLQGSVPPLTAGGTAWQPGGVLAHGKVPIKAELIPGLRMPMLPPLDTFTGAGNSSLWQDPSASIAATPNADQHSNALEQPSTLSPTVHGCPGNVQTSTDSQQLFDSLSAATAKRRCALPRIKLSSTSPAPQQTQPNDAEPEAPAVTASKPDAVTSKRVQGMKTALQNSIALQPPPAASDAALMPFQEVVRLVHMLLLSHLGILGHSASNVKAGLSAELELWKAHNVIRTGLTSADNDALNELHPYFHVRIWTLDTLLFACGTGASNREQVSPELSVISGLLVPMCVCKT